MTIIVAAVQPTIRPPAAGGGPLEAGDVWVHTLTGVRQRYDGAAWQPFSPVIIYATAAPTVRPAINGGGPLVIDDIYVHQTSGAQARWNGNRWITLEHTAGIVPRAGATNEHLAKASARPFETKWVDPADGIAFLHEQRVSSQTWLVHHELRSMWVAVTVVDDSGNPPVTMVPSIRYAYNRCALDFARAVSGFALIHASKPNSDVVVQ